MSKTEPEVIIKPNTNKLVETLETRIQKAASDWAKDIVHPENLREFENDLQEALNERIFDRLGLRVRKDSWSNKVSVNLDYDSRKPLVALIDNTTREQAEKLIHSITFEPVVLTEREYEAIQRAYRTKFKEAAIVAAQRLAEEQAYQYAKKVLRIEEV